MPRRAATRSPAKSVRTWIVVFTLDPEAAHVLAAPADADGEPGGEPVRVSAHPLSRPRAVNGRVSFASGRQGSEFGDQHAADNIRGPVDTRENFDQITVREAPLFHRYQRVSRPHDLRPRLTSARSGHRDAAAPPSLAVHVGLRLKHGQQQIALRGTPGLRFPAYHVPVGFRDLAALLGN